MKQFCFSFISDDIVLYIYTSLFRRQYAINQSMNQSMNQSINTGSVYTETWPELYK